MRGYEASRADQAKRRETLELAGSRCRKVLRQNRGLPMLRLANHTGGRAFAPAGAAHATTPNLPEDVRIRLRAPRRFRYGEELTSTGGLYGEFRI